MAGPTPWRLRRSLLITPGHRRERLEKAARLPADCLCFDLEDGVPPARKAEARATIAALLPALDAGPRERAVRLNAVGTEEWEQDLAALPWDSLDAVLVPKVETPEALRLLDQRLAALAGGRRIAVIATLETPRGVLNALAIAEASQNLAALFFGPGDYVVQTGAALTPRALDYPRAVIAAAAGAVGAQALDAPYLAGLRDPEGTRADALAARELGFSGKAAFHPDQLAPINAAFTPDAAEVAEAERFLAAWREAASRGEAVALAEGVFIAMDLAPRMERIVALARLAAERDRRG
jgi:citrate lyase beta subunit